MKLSTTVRNEPFDFPDLRMVMGCANEPKSGDVLAGVAARSATERVAARRVLADLPLSIIRENPAVPYEDDEVTRLIQDDADRARFARVSGWTVSQLREWVLAPTTTGADMLAMGRGLTSECIAAIAKLMTNLDLMIAGRKMQVVTHANTTLGLEGRLSVRLQPNHTTDDPHGILASAMEGLSFGVGDALIGVNPVIDSPESVTAVLSL